MAKEKIVEEKGLIIIDGELCYHVLVCATCGACVTITAARRYSQEWLYYLDDVMECCNKPYYFWGDYKHFYA